jgi:hypothetical protein
LNPAFGSLTGADVEVIGWMPLAELRVATEGTEDAFNHDEHDEHDEHERHLS